MSRQAIYRQTLLAGLVLLSGCAKVPDFMVEGRLPNFGDKPVEVAAQPAPPALTKATVLAAAPQSPAKAAPASPPAMTAQAAKPPVADKAAAPPTAMSMIVNAHGRDAPAATATAAPVTPPPPPVVAMAPPPPSMVSPPLAGGFAPATDKAAVKAIADFAVHESPGYVLKSVKSAQVQVVAGLNYDLCLKVRTPGHEASWVRQRYVKARVYQALDQHLELTSWNEVEGCE